MISVRRAKLIDLESIRALNTELFLDSKRFDNTLNLNWPKENKKYYEKSISSKNKIVVVATSNERIIGYLMGSIQKIENYRIMSKVAELDNMLVLKEFRGIGAGSLLVKKFVEWAKSKAVRKIRVSAYAQNAGAIAFYKRNGLEEHSLVLEGDI